MDWLKSVAPTIASLLGGPLAGLAVTALGSALNLPDATQKSLTDMLTAGQMTGEQIAALKQAELALQEKMKELDIQLDAIDAGDRASARQMQIANKSYVVPLLATLVTVGFFGILIGMMTSVFTVKDNQELLLLMGSLATSWGMVMNFFFGSSASSRTKDETISALSRS